MWIDGLAAAAAEGCSTEQAFRRATWESTVLHEAAITNIESCSRRLPRPGLSTAQTWWGRAREPFSTTLGWVSACNPDSAACKTLCGAAGCWQATVCNISAWVP